MKISRQGYKDVQKFNLTEMIQNTLNVFKNLVYESFDD